MMRIEVVVGAGDAGEVVDEEVDVDVVEEGEEEVGVDTLAEARRQVRGMERELPNPLISVDIERTHL